MRSESRSLRVACPPAISETFIATRVRELGTVISQEYRGRFPLVIGMLDDAAVFFADLTRAVTIPIELDLVAFQQQGDDVRILKDTSGPVEARDVLLVDASRHSAACVTFARAALQARRASSVESCTLLSASPAARAARYVALNVDDVDLVGYGLDDRGTDRHLPALYVMKDHRAG